MKIYLNLWLIFFGIFSFSEVAIAELPDKKEEAQTVIKSPRETTQKNQDAPRETTADQSFTTELSKIFPGCPLVEETVPTVIVETRNSKNTEIETKTDSQSSNNQQEEFISQKNESTNQENQVEIVNNQENERQNDSLEEKTETDTAKSKQKHPKQECPTVEEVIKYQTIAEADRLYRAGNKVAATKLYQEVKQPWHQEAKAKNLATPIYNEEQLSPGGKVYWRTYREGKKQQLATKIFAPLELLVTRQPDFIPGHITYAEELLAIDKEQEAYAVMEKAIGLYPNETNLLKAKIATDIKGERWLEASISARQFALFNPNLPEAKEFITLADRYLKIYQEKVEAELTWNAVGNAITGAAGFALTGNLFGPISAIDTTIMLLQGENKLGDRFAKKAQKQLPMLEDQEVNNYIKNIGEKIAAVAGRDEFNYEFFIIMDEELNAFALPGGKVFVNIGAILNTESEAELASLLAHEVSHSVLSHGFQLVTRGNLTSNVAQYIPYVGSTASSLIVMNYSRDMERQADVFGTRILVAADYSADGIRNLMQKLGEINAADEENPEPPAWLSTHPNTEQRVAYIENLVISNNLNRYAYEGIIEHQKMKQKAKKLWQQYQAEQEEEKEDKDK